MQRTPTSRKSGSNAPHRPFNFEDREEACQFTIFGKGDSDNAVFQRLLILVRRLVA
jgi:hypothetical protein